jgi:hypothetical protein
LVQESVVNGDVDRSLASPQAAVGISPAYTGNALDVARRAFQIYFALLPNWLVVALPAYLVMAALRAQSIFPFDAREALSRVSDGEVDELPHALLAVLLGSLVALAVESLVLLPLAFAVDRLEDGHPTPPLHTLGAALDVYPRVLWANLRAGLAIGFAALALILPGLYVALRLYLASVVAALSHSDPPFRRSWELTHGRVLQVLGVLLLLILPIVCVAGVSTTLTEISRNWVVVAVADALTRLLGGIPLVAAVLLYRQYSAARFAPVAAVHVAERGGADTERGGADTERGAQVESSAAGSSQQDDASSYGPFE